MGQDATYGKTKVNVAEVVRYGEKIILPAKPEPGMTNRQGAEILLRLDEQEQQVVNVIEDVEAFPWDGAHAAAICMERKFGVLFAETQRSMFGSIPPQYISVPTGVNETKLVPWGKFTVPTVEGSIVFGVNKKDQRMIFQLTATVKRKYEEIVRELANDIRKYVKEHSLYKGKAIRIQFTNEDGDFDEMPMPTFIDTNAVPQLILNRDLEDRIETKVFTPIEKPEKVRRFGGRLKRGVILAGPYGSGKTLLAFLVAKRATKVGKGFILCEKIVDLKHVLRFAEFFGDPVVFFEDFDRLMNGERSIQKDEILNLTDGVESKTSNVFTIATTNNVEEIQAAMMRPGRTDSFIRFEYPNAETVQRLVRFYARDNDGVCLVPAKEDLTEVGKILAGNSPAFIQAAVEDSRLAAIKLLPEDATTLVITAAAILEAAKDLVEHIALVNRKPEPKKSDLEKMGVVLGAYIAQSVKLGIEGLESDGVGVDQVIESFERQHVSALSE